MGVEVDALVVPVSCGEHATSGGTRRTVVVAHRSDESARHNRAISHATN
jgi:hypothetical protein